MGMVNVISETNNGIIVPPIVCKCDTRAGLIFADRARQLGVELDEDDVQAMGYNDLAISRVINAVDEQLEATGHELKWFEVEHLKRLK